MYKNLYRRMRVLLHRYPLLPFLLAATLAVDVLLMLFYSIEPQGALQRFLIGILISQFCLIGIWIVHRFKNLGLRLGIAVVYLSAFVFLFPGIENRSRQEIAIIAAVLSLVSAMTYTVINFMPRFGVTKNQLTLPSYSVKDLLVLSTSIAILFYALTSIKANYLQFETLVPSVCFGFLATVLWKLNGLRSIAIRILSLCLCYVMLRLTMQLPTFLSSFQIFTSEIKYLLKFFLKAISTPDCITTGVVVFTLTWAYGLQSRRQPIRQRKKKQQATPSESEQPAALKVVNQDEEPTEPPGPIDLTV